MKIITTTTGNNTINTAKSEGGRYTWHSANPDSMQDTVIGREIYQMRYCREGFCAGTDPMPEDAKASAMEFLAEVDKAVAEANDRENKLLRDADKARADSLSPAKATMQVMGSNW